MYRKEREMKQYVVNIYIGVARIASYTFESQWRAVDFIEEIRAGFLNKSILTELAVEEIGDTEESEVTND